MSLRCPKHEPSGSYPFYFTAACAEDTLAVLADRDGNPTEYWFDGSPSKMIGVPLSTIKQLRDHGVGCLHCVVCDGNIQYVEDEETKAVLLSCPFCGKQPEEPNEVKSPYGEPIWVINCQCNPNLPYTILKTGVTKEKVVDEWNTRSGDNKGRKLEIEAFAKFFTSNISRMDLNQSDIAMITGYLVQRAKEVG